MCIGHVCHHLPSCPMMKMPCSGSKRAPDNTATSGGNADITTAALTDAGAGLGSTGNLKASGPMGTFINECTVTNKGTLRSAKPCCLCWCCCCNCAWKQRERERRQRRILAKQRLTSSTANVENGSTRCVNSSDMLSGYGEPAPSLEEIRSWGRSFDKLMKNKVGRLVFRDFLRCEYSEENILFWQACEDLKKEADDIEEKTKEIYMDYISVVSPKEVSLDSHVREIVNRNMMAPTVHTFDEAQLQIYTLMQRDSYPRFVNSVIFKSLAKLTGTEDGDQSSNTDPTTSTACNAATNVTATSVITATITTITSTTSATTYVFDGVEGGDNPNSISQC